MADNREYMTHQEELGSIQISDEVIASIAAGAVLEVEGVCGLSSSISTIHAGWSSSMEISALRTKRIEELLTTWYCSKTIGTKARMSSSTRT